MNLKALLAIILGEAEALVPIFIHNPRSQQIEGVIVTTLNHALSQLAPQQNTPAAPQQ